MHKREVNEWKPYDQPDWNFGDTWDKNFDDFHVYNRKEQTLKDESNITISESKKTDVVHELFFRQNFDEKRKVIDIFADCFNEISEKEYYVLLYITQHIFEKRNLVKNPLPKDQLDSEKKLIYNRIYKLLQVPERNERIEHAMQTYSKRFITYFMVHYITKYPVCYYVDFSKYPYKIIGEFGRIGDPYVLEQMKTNDCIRWVNLHRTYRAIKGKTGHKNMNSPYRRSESTIMDGKCVFIAELSFYIWMDRNCAFDALERIEDDVKEKKKVYDTERREHEKKKRFHSCKKKRKISLKETRGENYESYFIPIPKRKKLNTLCKTLPCKELDLSSYIRNN